MEVGTLGDIVFEAGTMNVLVPQNISADSRMRYEEHNVFGSYPVMEWLGPETPEISLDVRLSRQLMERELDDVKIQLLSHMRRGDVLRLTLCGQNWGRVVITSISQRLSPTLTNDAGWLAPSGIDLSLRMKSWYWMPMENSNATKQ
jgi:hypothetical protein